MNYCLQSFWLLFIVELSISRPLPFLDMSLNDLCLYSGINFALPADRVESRKLFPFKVTLSNLTSHCIMGECKNKLHTTDKTWLQDASSSYVYISWMLLHPIRLLEITNCRHSRGNVKVENAHQWKISRSEIKKIKIRTSYIWRDGSEMYFFCHSKFCRIQDSLFYSLSGSADQNFHTAEKHPLQMRFPKVIFLSKTSCGSILTKTEMSAGGQCCLGRSLDQLVSWLIFSFGHWLIIWSTSFSIGVWT